MASCPARYLLATRISMSAPVIQTGLNRLQAAMVIFERSSARTSRLLDIRSKAARAANARRRFSTSSTIRCRDSLSWAVVIDDLGGMTNAMGVASLYYTRTGLYTHPNRPRQKRAVKRRTLLRQSKTAEAGSAKRPGSLLSLIAHRMDGGWITMLKACEPRLGRHAFTAVARTGLLRRAIGENMPPAELRAYPKTGLTYFDSA
jgi:hypothetical protein